MAVTPGDYDYREMWQFDLDKVALLSSGVSGFGHDSDFGKGLDSKGKEVEPSVGFLAETKAAKERRDEA